MLVLLVWLSVTAMIWSGDDGEMMLAKKWEMIRDGYTLISLSRLVAVWGRPVKLG